MLFCGKREPWGFDFAVFVAYSRRVALPLYRGGHTQPSKDGPATAQRRKTLTTYAVREREVGNFRYISYENLRSLPSKAAKHMNPTQPSIVNKKCCGC